jgi:DNA-directed RNA polymerase specialized sigma24 family protein
LSEKIFEVKTMHALITETSEKTQDSTILKRIAERDKTAVEDCINAYGNFIWALARKFTHSRKEAATVTEEIFIDIWRYCEDSARHTKSTEKKLIAALALRHLVKPSQQARQKSMASKDAANEQGTGIDRVSEYV